MIEEANPLSEMITVVMPSVYQDDQAGQTATQPLNPPSVSTEQEKVMVERNEIAIVAAAQKRSLTLVIEPQAAPVPATEVAHISTPMPTPASAIISRIPVCITSIVK